LGHKDVVNHRNTIILNGTSYGRTMRQRILVTGGMGFIGSNFVRYMLAKHEDIDIVNLDKLTYAGNLRNLEGVKERHRFILGDVCDVSMVDRLVKECSAIVHFAAETHVDRSIAYAGKFVTTDIIGTFVLLEAARKHGIERFIQISTDEVYGEAPGRPSLESDALMPKSPYAASKAGADQLAYSYFMTHKIPVTITRCSNNYGPYQYPEKLIPLFVTNALEGKKLPVYGTGKNTRDWIFVDDHCAAIDLLLQHTDLNGEVFNIGTGEEKSVLDIASAIVGTLGVPDDLLEHIADRPGHVLRHAVDSSKLRSLGWRPKYRFTEAITRTIEWYRDHEEWWKPIKTGGYKAYYETQYRSMSMGGA